MTETDRPPPTGAGLARTVLVVDDEAAVMRFLRVTLMAQGYRVLEAVTGEQALVEAATRAPDLVLLDLGLPDLDGVEATRRILAKSPGTRVLAFSANSDRASVRRMLAAGAQGYLVKTSDPVELITALQKVLAGERFVSAEPDGRSMLFLVIVLNRVASNAASASTSRVVSTAGL